MIKYRPCSSREDAMCMFDQIVMSFCRPKSYPSFSERTVKDRHFDTGAHDGNFEDGNMVPARAILECAVGLTSASELDLLPLPQDAYFTVGRIQNSNGLAHLYLAQGRQMTAWKRARKARQNGFVSFCQG